MRILRQFYQALPTLFFVFCALVMVGIIYSPYLLSIGLLGMLGSSLLAYFPAIKSYFKYPSFWTISLLFVIVLMGFWSIEDPQYWVERLRIKLPFLLLPIAFYLQPKLTEKQFLGLLYFWIVLLFLTSIGIGGHYLLHRNEIITMMAQGHPIPTPRNHIRFSTALAMGVLSGWYLIKSKFYLKKPIEKKLLIVMTLFLFIFIHFLSVRTGILALYVALGLVILSQTFLYKKYLLGMGMLLLLSMLPVLAYRFVPSFQTKINYMIWDLNSYQKGEGGNAADAGRITSLKVGYDIFSSHPIMGIGAGNLRKVTKAKFRKDYPQYVEALTPHNQFLYILAGSGVVGGLLFAIAFLFPLFYKNNYRHPLFLGFYGILFVTFILEHSIENAIGVAFSAFFLLLLINYLNGRLI